MEDLRSRNPCFFTKRGLFLGDVDVEDVGVAKENLLFTIALLLLKRNGSQMILTKEIVIPAP